MFLRAPVGECLGAWGACVCAVLVMGGGREQACAHNPTHTPLKPATPGPLPAVAVDVNVPDEARLMAEVQNALQRSAAQQRKGPGSSRGKL